MTEVISQVDENETTSVEAEETEEQEFSIPEFVLSDPLAAAMSDPIKKGIDRIIAANKILLAEEDTSGVREIDKAFKADAEKSDEEAELPEELRNFWKQAEEARQNYKTLLNNARNAYRVQVQGVEAVSDADADEKPDEEELRQVRTVVMNGVAFLKSYSETNNKSELLSWVNGLQIPQVNRKGTSSVGVKKPRVQVFILNGEGEEPTIYESFSQAAAALSTKENKYTAGEIAQVWADSTGSKADENFKFAEKEIFVRFKEKKAA